MSLKARAAKGVAWSFVGQSGRWLLGMALTAILARLLTRADFGLLGMVMVFHGLIGVFKMLGLNTAVIQNKDLTEGQLSAVFIMNVATGAALTAILYVLAPVIAAAYKEPELVNITRCISVSFIIATLTVNHEALLIKKLKFKRVVIAESIAMLPAGAIAAFAAYKGAGVYAPEVYGRRQRGRLSGVLIDPG